MRVNAQLTPQLEKDLDFLLSIGMTRSEVVRAGIAKVALEKRRERGEAA